MLCSLFKQCKCAAYWHRRIPHSIMSATEQSKNEKISRKTIKSWTVFVVTFFRSIFTFNFHSFDRESLTKSLCLHRWPEKMAEVTVSGWQGYRKCQTRSKVAFLKTHKCASSTVQNILMRHSTISSILSQILPHDTLNPTLDLADFLVGRSRQPEQT